MNDEYIPTPSRNATRLVVQTPRIAIIRMSTRGSRERSSAPIQAAMTANPITESPIVFGDPQPQLVAWLTASRTAVRPIDISPVLSQLTLPGTLIGDSGTKTRVAMAASRIAASGNQNNQW